MQNHIHVISAALLATFVVRWPCSGAERPDVICEAPGEASSFRGVLFSPDNRLVLTLDDESRLWRISDTNLVQKFIILNLQDSMTSAVFSPDGTTVTGSGQDERPVTTQWRVADGAALWSRTISGRDLAMLPDGRAMLRAGIFVMPTDGSSDGRRFGSTNTGGRFLRLSRDGSLLASGYASIADSAAFVWRTSDEAVIQSILLPSTTLHALDFSSDGKFLALGFANNDTRVYQVTNDTPPRILQTGDTRSLKFSPDGKLLLTASSGKLMFWRMSDGKLLKTYEDKDSLGEYDAKVDISPDGKLFAYGPYGPYNNRGKLIVARMPLLITNAAVRTNAFNLEWQGGSGLYQVQQSTNLSDGVWEAVAGPTNATALNVGLTNRAGFFRVQSLDPSP